MSTASNAQGRGLIFPFNLIFALLAAAVICVLAAAAYLAASQYAVDAGFEYLQLAVILWLLFGFGAGRLVAGAARRLGLRNPVLVLLLALASAWMMLVANWGLWSLNQPGAALAIGEEILRYAGLSPQGWVETINEWARISGRQYGGSFGEMFTSAQIYWLEGGVMATVAGLTVLIKSRR
ncbi:hypothetical protein [Abyssibius alkaniclasticus]|uniref:hypothetical protein n=1 Tax=Abyssibius alkaniclasticus TaxID=2881234 RepID=UPI004059E490